MHCFDLPEMQGIPILFLPVLLTNMVQTFWEFAFRGTNNLHSQIYESITQNAAGEISVRVKAEELQL